MQKSLVGNIKSVTERSVGQYRAYVVRSAHVAADSFAKTCQEVLLVTVSNLLNDAECIHLLLLTDALRDQCKCILTIYNQCNAVTQNHSRYQYLSVPS